MQKTKSPKKYKKLILTGVHIPPPPPSLTTLTPTLTPTSTFIPPIQKQTQQSIQKSSSSSEQQTFYQNYFQTKLDTMIQELLGDDVDFQVMELREGKEGEDFVDVVVRVGVGEDMVGEFKEKVREIKRENVQHRQQLKQKQNTYKNFTKKPTPPLPKSLPQSQHSSRNLNISPQTQTQTYPESSNDLQIHQQNPSSISILTKQNKSTKNNQSKTNKVKGKGKGKGREGNQNVGRSVEEEGKWDRVGDGDEDRGSSDQENDGERKDKAKGIQAQGNCRKSLPLAVCVLVTFTVIALSVYLISLLKTNSAISSQSQPQSSSQLPSTQPLLLPQIPKTKPYLGQIGQPFPKKTLIIPPNKRDQTTKIPVYYQTIPAVLNPDSSLHPRNSSYVRPTFMELYTFEDIAGGKGEQGMGLGKGKVMEFRYGEKEIQEYMKGLGKDNQSRIQGLYTQLHRNKTSRIALQAQYHHISKKYLSKYPTPPKQKPLCLITFSQNLYASQNFLPFFQSLFSQNYTKYRLIYIDNASEDPYEPIKIMNYLWDNFYQNLAIVGSQNFYFVRFGRMVGKNLGKFGIVREMCGDGDIVVEVDGRSQFVGRQGLRVVSAMYDGGSQRILLIPKSQLDKYMNPLKYYNKNRNLQIEDDLSNPTQTPQKIPTQPQPKSSTPSPSPSPSPSPPIIPSQPLSPQQPSLPLQPQQRVYVTRRVANVWSVYSNYIYTEVKKGKEGQEDGDGEDLEYRFVNSTEEILKMRRFYEDRGRFQENSRKLDKKYLSNTCLRTYVMPLHSKLSYSKFLPKTPSFKTPYIDSYSYDIQLQLSLLQMSGKFSPNPSSPSNPNSQKFLQISQPLCHRSDVIIPNKCEQMKKMYEEVIFMGRSEMKEIQGDINQEWVVAEEVGNFLKGDLKYQGYVEKLRLEMEKFCSY